MVDRGDADNRILVWVVEAWADGLVTGDRCHLLLFGGAKETIGRLRVDARI